MEAKCVLCEARVVSLYTVQRTLIFSFQMAEHLKLFWQLPYGMTDVKQYAHNLTFQSSK